MSATKRGSKVKNQEAEGEIVRGRAFPIVGIGASAGGFEAFRELLHALPPHTGMAFVLVQHLDPGHESMLSKLLSRSTRLPVSEVKDGITVQPDNVYVIPPNRMMDISDGVLHLTVRDEAAAKNMAIDYFLRSLADDQGSRAIGVILSGTASDGTHGLKAIKAEGGITFAQDEKSAKYDGMPRSAVAAGCVDFVLPPGAIAQELTRIGRHPYLGVVPPAKAAELPEADDDLRRIFVLLRSATGVDFTHYKYSTFKRRIARRMVVHKLESLKQYLTYLRDNRPELEALYEDVLIHVTSFFREPESFQTLSDDIFPKIMNTKPPGEAVRIWVPGCSTGEEAYSLAIVLVEYLGERATSTPIQIFGTDISDAAIDKARAGIYTESSLVDVSPGRLRRFFVKIEGGYQIAKSVREMCIFARQNLAKDPPFSKLDLVSCRNVLIYMGPVLQKKVIGIFHYALKSSGFLLLGKSESISGFSSLFTPVGRKNKLYSKQAAEGHPVVDLAAATYEYERAMGEPVKRKEAPARFDIEREADRFVLRRYAPAGLIVNEAMQILHFRGQCSPYVAPAAGEASLSLLKMVRPEFAVELRTALHKARKQQAAVRQEGIQWQRNGQSQETSLEVIPIKGEAGERYFLVLFEDAPTREPAQAKQQAVEPKVSKAQQSETLSMRRELQTTKDYLQSIIEEQEATNEELKSANEEVLSSNEELQSTNEELETAKEELQSTNEELVTVNEQMQNHNAELAQLSNDLANILAGVNIPIVILDNGRRIRRFTPLAEKLVNLLPSDLGRPIDNIRPNISIPDLDQLIGEVMDTLTVQEREVQDLDGRWYSLRIRPYKTTDNRIEGVVMVFIDVDPLKKSREALREERDFIAGVLETVPSLVMVVDRGGRIVRVNRACQEISGYSQDEIMGRRCWEFLAVPEEAERVEAMHRELLSGNAPGEEAYQWATKSNGRRLIAWASSHLRDEAGAVGYLIHSGVDVTSQRQGEEALRASEAALRSSQERLQTLAAGLLQLQEEERSRLARDLHDDISQRVAALALEAEALAKGLPKNSELFRSKIQSLAKRAAVLCSDLERTAHELHPAIIEHLGLVPALASLTDELSGQEGIKVSFTHRNLPASIPPATALCLFRVAQEALRNIVKHSGAKTARVALAGSDAGLQLSVSDTGSGFDPERIGPRKGLGLTSMEERVRLLGGSFSVDVKPGNGVKIHARVPLGEKANQTTKA